MIEDQFDSRYKYVEMSRIFHHRANELMMFNKQSARTCQRLVGFLAKEKPKTPIEFERHEFMKEFVLKTAQNNEAVIELVDYIQDLLNTVAKDSAVLIEGGLIQDQVKDQSDTIVALNQRLDLLTNLLKDDVSGRIAKATK